MNKRFFKNNLVLILVVALLSVAALVLLVFSLIEYVRMSKVIDDTDNLRTQIAKLIEKSPAPVEGNRKPIMADTELYSRAAVQFRENFGRPMRAAVNKFIETLYAAQIAEEVEKYRKEFTEELRGTEEGKKLNDGEAAKKVEAAIVAFRAEALDRYEKKFISEFREGWDRVDATNFAEKGLVLQEFKKRFSNWDQAVEAFQPLAQAATLEQLTKDNVEDVLLDAMGVPRLLQGKEEELKRFLIGYRTRVLDALTKIQNTSDCTFGFNLENTYGYIKEEYPIIVRHMDNIGDIIKRVAESGVKVFNGLEIRMGAPGATADPSSLMMGPGGGSSGTSYASSVESVGSFDIYHYTFEVTGSLDSVRKLVGLLDNAYLDNRFYLINSVFLYAPDYNAEQIFTPESDESDFSTGNPGAPQQQAPRSRSRSRRQQMVDPSMGMMMEPGMTPVNDEQEKLRRQREEYERREKERQAKLPYNERRGYGEIVAGGSQECQAVIDVDYIVLKSN